MTNITANYDEPWKEAIGDYFDSFLDFFFPDIVQLIDWDQPPVALDKELQQITASAETEKRFADKLFQIWLKDSRTAWILIHVEIQSQYDTNFAQRMFIYNYRAFDLYHQTVVSLAILGDDQPSWRPNSYQYALGGCEVKITFPIVKLLDYQWEQLEQSENIFAIMVMAHLKTKATTNNWQQREQWKWNLVRGLYDRGLTKLEIVNLFKFIDNMMTLPQELETSFKSKLNQYERRLQMPLLSNLEKDGMRKGLHKSTISLLEKRFNHLPNDLREAINQIEDISRLEQLNLETISVNSLAEFQDLINQNSLNS